MKPITKFLSIITLSFALYSCTKPLDAVDTLKKSCLYSDKIDYFKKWANTFTEIDTYSEAGTLVQSSKIYPIGYFKLNNDMSYNVFSDGVPQNGAWDINSNCQLVIDSNRSTQHDFQVLSLTNDSLTIRRKAGNQVYTQHYITYKCPDPAQLEKQWENTITVESYYDNLDIYLVQYIYPVGYFRLNADMSYNVLSNGVAQDGSWTIDPSSCRIVLDKGVPAERAFDIQKLTTDSLTIWRKDTVKHINYLQHYKSH